jgi:putative sigma-54 modulation protein
MHIEIQARGFHLTEGLRAYIVRRLKFALSWASHGVRKVVVRLLDINGPRGGEDKRCHIQIAFPGSQNVVIEDTETDLYVAIDRAVDRAERSVARRMERSRQHRRPSAKTAAPDAASALLPADADAAADADAGADAPNSN